MWQEKLSYTTRQLFRETDRAIGYKYVSATHNLDKRWYTDGQHSSAYIYGKTVGWGGGVGRGPGAAKAGRRAVRTATPLTARDNPQTETQAITSMH